MLMWISIIKTNNRLNIHGNEFPSFFFNKDASTLYSKNMSANYRKHYLKSCPLTKFGIIAHMLPLIAHVLASLELATHLHGHVFIAPSGRCWETKPSKTEDTL